MVDYDKEYYKNRKALYVWIDAELKKKLRIYCINKNINMTWAVEQWIKSLEM